MSAPVVPRLLSVMIMRSGSIKMVPGEPWLLDKLMFCEGGIVMESRAESSMNPPLPLLADTDNCEVMVALEANIMMVPPLPVVIEFALMVVLLSAMILLGGLVLLPMMMVPPLLFTWFALRVAAKRVRVFRALIVILVEVMVLEMSAELLALMVVLRDVIMLLLLRKTVAALISVLLLEL